MKCAYDKDRECDKECVAFIAWRDRGLLCKKCVRGGFNISDIANFLKHLRKERL